MLGGGGGNVKVDNKSNRQKSSKEKMSKMSIKNKGIKTLFTTMGAQIETSK